MTRTSTKPPKTSKQQRCTKRYRHRYANSIFADVIQCTTITIRRDSKGRPDCGRHRVKR